MVSVLEYFGFELMYCCCAYHAQQEASNYIQPAICEIERKLAKGLMYSLLI